jgi:hypothetical protein
MSARGGEAGPKGCILTSPLASPVFLYLVNYRCSLRIREHFERLHAAWGLHPIADEPDGIKRGRVQDVSCIKFLHSFAFTRNYRPSGLSIHPTGHLLFCQNARPKI